MNINCEILFNNGINKSLVFEIEVNRLVKSGGKRRYVQYFYNIGIQRCPLLIVHQCCVNVFLKGHLHCAVRHSQESTPPDLHPETLGKLWNQNFQGETPVNTAV